MKRRFITKNDIVQNYIPIDVPDNLKDYAEELRLLKGIPLTYLLSDVSDLKEESLRFFILDINWTDALLDGAFSIGRVCVQDGMSDNHVLKGVSESRNYLNTSRIKRMHHNHKNDIKLSESNSYEDYKVISGFIMRSQLVRKMKGLHLYGYDQNGAPKSNTDDGTPLHILRMEEIADNILICLFSGEVSEVMFAEPKAGLRFGVSTIDELGTKTSRKIDLRSILEDGDFGKRINSFCIDDYTDDNGRLHAKKLADSIEKQLKIQNKLGTDKITPARFAFEMIAVAHRAKFISCQKEEKNV